MGELSERARKLMQQLDALSSRKQQESLIEQALLAERAKVWEEAIGIAYHAAGAKVRIIEALRAAAEKEVAK